MATKLERLLQEIDPSRTIDPVERRIDAALARYQRQTNRVASWEEMETSLADMVQLGRNAALNLPAETSQNQHTELDFQMAMQYLAREHSHDTYRMVYDIMSSGAEGGVFAISRTLARLMAADFSQNEINGRVQAFWDSLPADEKLAAAEEYISRYQEVLPERTRQDSILIKASFLKVLQDHPHMIKRLRDLKRPS